MLAFWLTTGWKYRFLGMIEGKGLKKMCCEMRGVGKVKENGYGNSRAMPSIVGKVINLRASSGFMPLALLNVKSAS